MRIRSSLLALVLLLAACDSAGEESLSPPVIPPPQTVAEDDYIITASGLKYFDLVPGTGEEAVVGRQLEVHYIGWLTDGTLFDSSLLREQPFLFILGAGQVIAGWDEGLEGMQVGGTRQLVLPPSLGYGSNAAGSIPPNSTLIFEVELLDVRGGTAVR